MDSIPSNERETLIAYFDQALSETASRSALAETFAIENKFPEDADLSDVVSAIRHVYLQAERDAILSGESATERWAVLDSAIHRILESERQRISEEQAIPFIPDRSETALLKQQISNLLQFKKLFYQINDQLDTLLEEKANAPAVTLNYDAPTPSSVNFNDLHALSGEQDELVQQLQDALYQLEIEDTQLRSRLFEQIDQLKRLERMQQESKDCMSMLERETDRLTQENEALKNELQKAADTHSAQSVDEVTEIIQLRKEIEDATQSAFTSMMANADLGAVILFLMRSFEIEEPDTMVQELFRACQSYGVLATVQVRFDGKTLNFSDGSSLIRQSDVSIIEKFKSASRYNQFKDTLFVNSDSVSIVATKLPLQDADRMSRLKDNLSTLITGADSRIKALSTDVKFSRQRKSLETLVKTTHKALQSIEKGFREQTAQTANSYNRILKDFGMALGPLALPGDQKAMLIKVLELGRTQLLSAQSTKLNSDFSAVISQLNSSFDRGAL